jgi:hypothetical protein
MNGHGGEQGCLGSILEKVPSVQRHIDLSIEQTMESRATSTVNAHFKVTHSLASDRDFERRRAHAWRRRQPWKFSVHCGSILLVTRCQLLDSLDCEPNPLSCLGYEESSTLRVTLLPDRRQLGNNPTAGGLFFHFEVGLEAAPSIGRPSVFR